MTNKNNINQFIRETIKKQLLNLVNTEEIYKNQYSPSFISGSIYSKTINYICFHCAQDWNIRIPITDDIAFCRLCNCLLFSFLSLEAIYNEIDYFCNNDIITLGDIWRFNQLIRDNRVKLEDLKRLYKKFFPNFPIDLII